MLQNFTYFSTIFASNFVNILCLNLDLKLWRQPSKLFIIHPSPINGHRVAIVWCSPNYIFLVWPFATALIRCDFLACWDTEQLKYNSFAFEMIEDLDDKNKEVPGYHDHLNHSNQHKEVWSIYMILRERLLVSWFRYVPMWLCFTWHKPATIEDSSSTSIATNRKLSKPA